MSTTPSETAQGLSPRGISIDLPKPYTYKATFKALEPEPEPIAPAIDIEEIAKILNPQSIKGEVELKGERVART